MKATLRGSYYVVNVSTADVQKFAAQWPNFGPKLAVWFEFDARNGDLVDMGPHTAVAERKMAEMDQAGLTALSEDAGKYGAKKLKLKNVEHLRGNPRGTTDKQKSIRSRGKSIRVRKNPTARIRRPAQKRRRSGFPGHIVTFIRPNAFYRKRQYIGGSKGRWTVVYKRNLAQVFSTSDKAKNVVRNNRKWFELNGVKQVTILQTNEAAGKFD